MGGDCFCFDTLRTKVDQIPEITEANVNPRVFNRRDSARLFKEEQDAVGAYIWAWLYFCYDT